MVLDCHTTTFTNIPSFWLVNLSIMAADQPVDGVEAKAQVAQEAVAPDAAPATTVAAVAPAEQGATDVPELGMC